MRRTSTQLRTFTVWSMGLLLSLVLSSFAAAPHGTETRPTAISSAGRASAGHMAAAIPAARQAQTLAAWGQLPLYFIESQGQVDARVAYYVQGRDTSVYFTPDGVTFALTGPGDPQSAIQAPVQQAALQTGAGGPAPSQQSARQRWALKLDFIGANPNVRPSGQDLTPAVISYFKGPREQWQTGLKTYATLVYADLWPGIDLIYSATVHRLKYTFVVKPGGDPQQIRLAYRGATAVRLTGAGQLEVTTPVGSLHDDRPYAYQEMEGQRVEVAAAYALEAEEAGERRSYGFRVGVYDPSQPLVLDPAVLVYAGYIGGSGNDPANGIAVDSAGHAYVTGLTTSTEATFPATVGPDLTYNGGLSDVFVAKVNAAGTGLVYAGYIGGAGDEAPTGIAVDSDGNAYVTGFTSSTEATFPVTGGPDLTHNGGTRDAFVAKVNAAGTGLVYAGYIGGSSPDEGSGIAVDSAGNAYVAGFTLSTQATFPVTVGPDLTYNGSFDAFVAKVNAAGTALVYAGYIGGAGQDQARGIVVDSAGNAYITGTTTSDETTFPVIVGPDLTYNGGTDAFVAKVNAAGTGLVYAGYIGGSNFDGDFSAVGGAIALDSAGNVYIAATTSSDETTFPVTIGPDLTHNGGTDAFVAKVNAAGTGLVYAGYIGGAVNDQGRGIAVDSEGNAYVAGTTASTEATFPVTRGPDRTYNGGTTDAFVAKVAADGTELVYAGYIGGTGVDEGRGIAVDSEGNAYVAGLTTSTEATFPVTGGPDLTHNGGIDAFVAKIRDAPEQVMLEPLADTNPVGTSHTVTATVTVLDAPDQPVPDVTVEFMVTGSVSAAGSCTTDVNGECSFTYPGPPLPGADLITAYADTNNNQIQDPGEPTAEATKAWVLPASTPGHVTGGGHILAPNLSDEIAFGFNARSTDKGFSGRCNVIDPSTEPKTHIKCVDVTALVQTETPGGGGTATFFGNATVNGVSTTYRIDVADVAEPGAGQDSFSILTSSGYAAGGLLTRGNIQVRR